MQALEASEAERDALEALQPDVIGLSAMTYEAGCMHELAREVKRRMPEVKIVCGGPHPSVAAEDVMADPAVDFVVRGEGEETFCELPPGGVPGIRAARDGHHGWARPRADGGQGGARKLEIERVEDFDGFGVEGPGMGPGRGWEVAGRGDAV